MKLTTNHPQSSYGIPIFVDDENNPMDYIDGIRALLDKNGWTYQDLADQTGYSKRTCEGWGQGRMPPKPALIIISHLLK